MKIRYIYYTLLLSILFSFNACTFFEDEIFDESAAIRLNETIANSKEVLEGSENGWVMLYFANNESPNYMFFMKFDSNGIADVGAKHEYTNRRFVVNQGCWDVVGDNGPVLTFNTYIDNFTIFADPVKPGAKPEELDGVGLGGDYEFNIISVSTDRVELKGKKRGTRLLMYRCPAVVSEWENYFDEESARSSQLFYSGSPRLYMEIENETYSFSANSGMFTIIEKDLSSVIDAEEEFLPYVITPDGVRFSTFFRHGDTSVIEFDFNDDNTVLVDRNGTGVTMVPQSEATYVLETANHYYAERSNIGGAFLQLFDEADAEFQTVYGIVRKLNSFGFRCEKGQFYFLVNAGGAIASFDLPVTVDDEKNTLTVAAFDVNNMTFTDRNANNFYNGITGGSSERAPIETLKKILKEVQGEYSLKAENIFTQSTITYVKTGNASDFMTVIRKN